ncbi:MAG TPA: DNA mismatch endonuclease Vsr [Phycisphaerales bacterium]|nr:DNA mismatch endonuclease Vsr [Phycisphaerales bacterium]HMP38040.1 DNA mismatch endonuclease Vsr [Phycisphaerales bacterium]
MADTLTPAQRSRVMASIRATDTEPERFVRSVLHGMGYRFRLHVRALPGTPDIVLPRHRTVVLVHGCFWHRHARCRNAGTPATRRRFWMAKFARNVERDRAVQRALRRAGWRIVVVWECQIRRAARDPGRRARLSARLAQRIGRSAVTAAEETSPHRGLR